MPQASAQRPASDILEQQAPAINSFAEEADKLASEVDRNNENDARLVEIRLQLETMARQLLQTGVAFRPRLASINARLEQLGAPPGEGQPTEPEIIVKERNDLAAEKAEINALIGEAEAISLRVNRLVDQIGVMRRDLFQNLLTKRYDINFALAGEVVEGFVDQNVELYKRIASWLRFVVRFKLTSVLLATFLALSAAAVLLIGGRRLFGRLIEPNDLNERPSYLSRLSVAFWSTLLPTVALTVFFTATYVLYDNFGVLRGDIGELLTSLFIVIGLVFFVHRLGSAVLSPRLPNWRLLAVEDRPARLLLWLVTTMAVLTAVDGFLSSVYKLLGAPLSLTVGESLVATVLTGLCVVLIGLVRPFAAPDGRQRGWNPLLRLTFFALGGVTIVAALAGYIGFASFLRAQIVVTGALLATMYIGFLSARAISEEGALARTALGHYFENRFKLDQTTLDQLALVVSIAINIFILVIGLPLILFLWGFQPGDIQAWVYRIATGFSIGSVSISLIGIVTGIFVFVVGYFLTRWFQGWLDGSVMARGRVDPGVRNSIRTAIGYAGVAIAALVGVSAAGIDLSNLALVAGALSLGIGFGLQNVVSNFVSGLILLAERPFKAGDWIVAGGVSGTVRKISVRATEIETFQRQTMILPNSELINAAVGNWTHKNKLGRIEITVGIAYGSDAKKAHAILLDIARNHPLVLKNPEPFVLFSGFGASSLDFEIRLFLADIMNGIIVQNDVRFAILDRFEAEGIEIPFPQSDVTIKSVNGALLEAARGEEKADPHQPGRRRKARTDPQ